MFFKYKIVWKLQAFSSWSFDVLSCKCSELILYYQRNVLASFLWDIPDSTSTEICKKIPRYRFLVKTKFRTDWCSTGSVPRQNSQKYQWQVFYRRRFPSDGEKVVVHYLALVLDNRNFDVLYSSRFPKKITFPRLNSNLRVVVCVGDSSKFC